MRGVRPIAASGPDAAKTWGKSTDYVQCVGWVRALQTRGCRHHPERQDAGIPFVPPMHRGEAGSSTLAALSFSFASSSGLRLLAGRRLPRVLGLDCVCLIAIWSLLWVGCWSDRLASSLLRIWDLWTDDISLFSLLAVGSILKLDPFWLCQRPTSR